MSKKCGKCEKTVYPAEELKCLDKTWHKNCFRCWECNMQLTMKNYKGFNKLPYCNAHYPQTKATVVAETPESRRLKNITEMNSSVKYHEEFEKSKGAYTSVADDPETTRIKGLSSVISPNSYGGGRDAGNTRPMRGGDDDDDQGGDSYAPPPQQGRQGMPLPTPPGQGQASMGLVYVAVYDYDAQDEDEVSFQEGDRIINSEVIDDGWITGTVQKTGKKGMIPANYVEQA